MINKIKNFNVNKCVHYSVYDMNGYSVQEVLCQFFEVINNLVESNNSITNTVNELLDWVHNEGLEIEVTEVLNKWLSDGTIESLINENIFNELNQNLGNLKGFIDDEILKRIESDKIITDLLEDEKNNRIKGDSDLLNTINDSVDKLTKVDGDIMNQIDSIKNKSQRSELLLYNNITNGFIMGSYGNDKQQIFKRKTWGSNEMSIDILLGTQPNLDIRDVNTISNDSRETSFANIADMFYFKARKESNGVFYEGDIQINGNWIGGLIPFTGVDTYHHKDLIIDNYGASQGVTMDEDNIYTSNNRLDMINYHVMKYDKNGNLIKGIILDGTKHPCDICLKGDELIVLSNNYPDEYIKTKIYIIDKYSLSVKKTFDLDYVGSGKGFSGISFDNGNYYAIDWVIDGNTNIYKMDTDFNIIQSKVIPFNKIQGIDFSNTKIVLSSTSSSNLIILDKDYNHIRSYGLNATTEIEGICVNNEGYIVIADVDRLHYISPVTFDTNVDTQVYTHMRISTKKVGDNCEVSFYLNGIKQVSKIVSGYVNLSGTRNLIIGGKESGKDNPSIFKLLGFGISNTASNTSVLNPNSYPMIWLDCTPSKSVLDDMRGAEVIKRPSSLVNYSYNIGFTPSGQIIL